MAAIFSGKDNLWREFLNPLRGLTMERIVWSAKATKLLSLGGQGGTIHRQQMNGISERVIGAAIEVHRELGPGLLESVYQECMLMELRERGMGFQAQVPVHIHYKGHKVDSDPLRLDLLVDDEVVVELKSVEEILPVHKKQLLSYLKLAGKSLGLLINFNEVLLKDGITRMVN